MNTNWTLRMIRFALLVAAVLLAPAAVTAVAATLDCPGATATFANDIHDSGVVVGTCYDANGVAHGFRYQLGVYTTIDYPGADWTQITGINGPGTIVGYYGFDNENRFYGFKLDDYTGEFSSIDRGAPWSTMPQDIADWGDIVGCVHNPGAMFGWLLRDGVFTAETIGQGWSGFSMYTGIGPAGIVGWYGAGNVIRSFILDHRGRTDFEFPGASNTQAWDTNLHGEVVGWYGPASTSRGFLYNDTLGSFAQIHVPGADWTRAFGINRGHQIVGAYSEGGRVHGFVLP